MKNSQDSASQTARQRYIDFIKSKMVTAPDRGLATPSLFDLLEMDDEKTQQEEAQEPNFAR